MNVFRRIWDWIKDFIFMIASWAILLLPESPFQKFAKNFQESSPFANMLNYINYFVPVGPMMSFLATYLAAVTIWYIVRWVLRLAKYID